MQIRSSRSFPGPVLPGQPVQLQPVPGLLDDPVQKDPGAAQLAPGDIPGVSELAGPHVHTVTRGSRDLCWELRHGLPRRRAWRELRFPPSARRPCCHVRCGPGGQPRRDMAKTTPVKYLDSGAEDINTSGGITTEMCT